MKHTKSPQQMRILFVTLIALHVIFWNSFFLGVVCSILGNYSMAFRLELAAVIVRQFIIPKIGEDIMKNIL